MPIHHHYHHPPAIVMKVGDERPVPLTQGLKKEYEHLYSSQVGNPSYDKVLELSLSKVSTGNARYKVVASRTSVPWYIIGIMHLMECDSRFDCHLHNGDPLKHKTIHVPIGRPLQDTWTWEDSAVDALELEKKQSWDARGIDSKTWDLGNTLYRLEAWNGFGSRNHGVPSAYLWAGTKFYMTGKYGADGKWNQKLRSEQIGAAPLLKQLNKKGIINFPEVPK